MNQRIQQLAEQATTIVEMVGPQGYTSSYANFDREKFAELIVQECALWIELQDEAEHPTAWLLSEELKERFGVEE